MSFSGGLYLTNSGRLALSKVQADSAKTLHFTKFAFGDGALNGGVRDRKNVSGQPERHFEYNAIARKW